MARDRGGVVDLVLHLLAPALVVGLVGSLVFFLAEVFYRGQYTARLNWTLFFFVFGTVLIARIAAELDAGRAAWYGLALGGVVFAGLATYVDHGGAGPAAWLINLVLMAVVWFSAHRLTTDCAVYDDGRGVPPGLLESAGLEAIDPDAGRVRAAEDLGDAEDGDEPEEADRPPPPGRWVVYFSLAAVPLFGLGSSLIPPGDGGRRAYAFWLLAVYLACALALLVTTSFLALRRSLRQRRLAVPAALTATWLGAGAAMVVVVLLAAAVVPRPETAYAAWANRAGSKDRSASQASAGGGEAGKGEGRPGGDRKGDGKAADGKGGGRGRPGGDQKGDAKGGEKGSGSGGDAKGGSGDRDGKSGASGGDRKGDGRDRGSSSSGDQQSSSASPPPPPPVSLAVPDAVRWLAFLVVVVASVLVIAWLVTQRAEKPKRKASAEEDVVEAEVADDWPPFARFREPGDGRPLAEQVRYSFRAMESWGADRGHPRGRDETPAEYAARLDRDAGLSSAAGLAALVGRLEYAGGRLPASGREAVRRFWAEASGGLSAGGGGA